MGLSLSFSVDKFGPSLYVIDNNVPWLSATPITLLFRLGDCKLNFLQSNLVLNIKEHKVLLFIDVCCDEFT